jgi:hypothetical protein
MSQNFYQALPSFRSFSDFTLDQHYTPVPPDWSIIITDIRGSTVAISEGRYKEVNTIGAASIVVARKAIGEEFPFVFGGDGATMLIATQKREAVLEALCRLRALSEANYGLELRVGIVPMAELLAQNAPVEVAKLELAAGRCVSCLRGPGVGLAENWIKAPESRFVVTSASTGEPDLSELSCRWSPIPSRNGKILSLIVSSRVGSPAYSRFLGFLQGLFPEGLDELNPVNIEASRYNSFWESVTGELKLHSSVWSLSALRRVLEIAFATLVFKFGLPGIFFDKGRYQRSMRGHSDYRKFDDVLKMVIDCSEEKLGQIRRYLEEAHRQGELFFGTFVTDSSLMTCFVGGLNDGDHIHFIDADGGGYTAAAVGLKQQIKAARLSG